MSKAPDAFGELKAAMRRRLEMIAAPLEAIYTEQRLGERLGSLGEATQGAKLALDDAGLLPMPKAIFGYKPSSKAYETFLLRLIVMASIALDGAAHASRASPPLSLSLAARPWQSTPPLSSRSAPLSLPAVLRRADLFASKLRKAIETVGDPARTEVEGRDTRIFNADGSLLATITRAPVKSRARMLNKLESADDHKHKPMPRPKANVDTVRAGVVVEDVDRMAEVHAAIGEHVGPYLRSKNAFLADAETSYGYRAFLGNLRLESGLTVGEVFGGEQRAKWEALGDAGFAADGMEPSEVKAVLDALLATSGDWEDELNAGIASLPLNIAAEVQLIYRPYLDYGRKLSHLPYKVARCEEPSELARDAGGKRVQGREERREREKVCGGIVEELLALRA